MNYLRKTSNNILLVPDNIQIDRNEQIARTGADNA